MNRGPGNNLIRVFILGLGQDGAASGRRGGERREEERPQSFTRCTICDTLLYNAGERSALSAPQSLSCEGEKRAAEILYGVRAERGGPLAARSHTRTTWTRLASFFSFFSPFFFRSRKKERDKAALFSPVFFREGKRDVALVTREREISSHAARSAAYVTSDVSRHSMIIGGWRSRAYRRTTSSFLRGTKRTNNHVCYREADFSRRPRFVIYITALTLTRSRGARNRKEPEYRCHT